MRDFPALTVTVNWAVGVATVTVHGDLDPDTCSQLRERLAWVAENCPRRLVLDLRGVADGCGEQIITLVAAARQQLPPGCRLDVRPAVPALRGIIDIGGRAERGSARAGAEAEPDGAGGRRACPGPVPQPGPRPGAGAAGPHEGQGQFPAHRAGRNPGLA